MQENINYNELEKSLNRIREISEKVKLNLMNINNIIEQNINSGAGILDGNSAELFRKKWDSLKDDLPVIIDSFKVQATNIELFIETTKKDS